MRILDPIEAPTSNNHDGLNTYGKNKIKTLIEFYGKIKKNENNVTCEAVLDRNALIKEWKMSCNIICDYKDFQFIET